MNYKRKLYRYILGGTVNSNDPICNYHLISQNHFPEHQVIIQAVRIPIPTNLKLQKNRNVSYNTTKDTRTLKELKAKLVVKINGRWKENPCGMTIENTQPNSILPELRRHNYFYTEMGYLDKSRYTFFIDHYAQNPENPMDYNTFDKAYKKYMWENHVRDGVKTAKT